MNTPTWKHKPKDQLLSKPVKLKSDQAYSDMTGDGPEMTHKTAEAGKPETGVSS